MNIKELLKEIKGVFKLPVKKYYIGKIVYGCPYFEPTNFDSSIISIRKLKVKSDEEIEKYLKDKPWLNKVVEFKYTNLPMVRRAKDWVFKVFGTYYWLQVGWPIMVHWNELGWKTKWESVRFEWPPAFYIYFFKWQFCIFWNAPDRDNDLYYEMILHYVHNSHRDIEKAEETWGWVNGETKLSTWNKDYLV